MLKRLYLIFSLSLYLLSGLNAQEVNRQPLSIIPYPVNLVEGEGCLCFLEK